LLVITNKYCDVCEQLLGDLLFRQNEFDKAMSEFQKLLQEKPGYYISLFCYYYYYFLTLST